MFLQTGPCRVLCRLYIAVRYMYLAYLCMYPVLQNVPGVEGGCGEARSILGMFRLRTHVVPRQIPSPLERAHRWVACWRAFLKPKTACQAYPAYHICYCDSPRM